MPGSPWSARLGLVAVAAALSLGAAAPAYAATSSIDHVETRNGTVRAVVSLADLPDGTRPDLGSVEVTYAGSAVEATAKPLSDTADLRRTAVLALDVSNSMAGEKFDQAKLAAGAFLDAVPANVEVGLVTFADQVTVAQAPTRDREAVREVIDGLALSQWTRVHDGVLTAVDVAGTEGARSVLLLSDGEDTSKTPVDDVTAAVADVGVQVDVVALGEEVRANEALERIALAGDGQVVTTSDPAALSALFAEEAGALADQVLVSFDATAATAGTEGTLTVGLEVAGRQVTDGAFVVLPPLGRSTGEESDPLGTRLPAAETGFVMPTEWMLGGLVLATAALLAVAYVAFGRERAPTVDRVDARIEAYTRRGAAQLADARRAPEGASVTQQAVAVAENVLDSSQGLQSALGTRLEAAGMGVKPAEWLLLHVGVSVGLGMLGLLLGAGNVLFMLLGLVLGAVLPWVYLNLKRRRRVAAFSAQLADTLQLMAGSLSAGLSLAQAVDTVVREGSDPMAGELRRALVETRLGVEIEDALGGVADRMQSVDFAWVVMAIRIQRDVGGNLSELLTKVSETIREREYLERQIKALSAEGRLSVYVLIGLPPGFMLYLLLAQPEYLEPLYTTPMGWLMLGVMAVLLTTGWFWMKKVIKVEV